MKLEYLAEKVCDRNYIELVESLDEIDKTRYEKAKRLIADNPLFHGTDLKNIQNVIDERKILPFAALKKDKDEHHTIYIDTLMDLDKYVFCSLEPNKFYGNAFFVINPKILDRKDVLVTKNDIAHIGNYFYLWYVQFIDGEPDQKIIEYVTHDPYVNQLLNGPQFKDYLARLIASNASIEPSWEIKVPNHIPIEDIIEVTSYDSKILKKLSEKDFSLKVAPPRNFLLTSFVEP